MSVRPSVRPSLYIVYILHIVCVGGSVVELSPATWKAWVGFLANVTFNFEMSPQWDNKALSVLLYIFYKKGSSVETEPAQRITRNN